VWRRRRRRGAAPNLFPISRLHNGRHKSENNLICNVDVVSRGRIIFSALPERRGLTSKCNLRRGHFRENIKPEPEFSWSVLCIKTHSVGFCNMMVIRSVSGTEPDYPLSVYFDNNCTIVLHFADVERP
jgi:hypothetical protein